VTTELFPYIVIKAWEWSKGVKISTSHSWTFVPVVTILDERKLNFILKNMDGPLQLNCAGQCFSIRMSRHICVLHVFPRVSQIFCFESMWPKIFFFEKCVANRKSLRTTGVGSWWIKIIHHQVLQCVLEIET
jgi:hypothetical protein